jgi:tetratricopeptide (TPR) repeat protein
MKFLKVVTLVFLLSIAAALSQASAKTKPADTLNSRSGGKAKKELRWDQLRIRDYPIYNLFVKARSAGAGSGTEPVQWKFAKRDGKPFVDPYRKKNLKKLLSLYPDTEYADDAVMLLARAKFFYDNDAKGAIKDLYKVISKYPKDDWIAEDPQFLEHAMISSLKRGKTKNGEPRTNGWFGRYVPSLQEIEKMPESPHRKNTISLAIRHHEKLTYFKHLDEYPNLTADEARYWIAKIIIYAKLTDRYDEAISNLQKVVNAHKVDKRAEIDLFESKKTNGRLIWERFPRTERKSHVEIIDLYMKMQDFSKAKEAAEDYISLHKGHVSVYNVHLKAGQAYEFLGDWDKVAEHFEKLLGCPRILGTTFKQEYQRKINEARNKAKSSQKPKPSDTLNSPLPGDMNAEGFSRALLGTWKSAYTYRKRGNVQLARFLPNGTAAITVVKDGLKNTMSGQYKLEFEREPRAHMVTFARITIKSLQGDLVLSRVSFSSHNGVVATKGPLLRIDKEPYGALERVLPAESKPLYILNYRSEETDASTVKNTPKIELQEFLLDETTSGAELNRIDVLSKAAGFSNWHKSNIMRTAPKLGKVLLSQPDWAPGEMDSYDIEEFASGNYAVAKWNWRNVADGTEPLLTELPEGKKEYYLNRMSLKKRNNPQYLSSFFKRKLETLNKRRKSKLQGEMFLTICVAPSSVGAQEFLLATELQTPVPERIVIADFVEGKQNHLGDFGYISAGINRGGIVGFVRDNICVKIRSHGSFEGEGLKLAKKIDSLTLKQPKLTKQQFNDRRPKIRLNKQENKKSAGGVGLSYNVSVPSGQKVISVKGKGFSAKDGKIRFLGKQAKKGQVKVTAISDELLVGVATYEL